MAGIVMISSYPKSGNTWFRIFLTNLMVDKEMPASINTIKTQGIAAGREIFDVITGIESSDLTFDEIDNVRPDVYKYIASKSENTIFMKIHDAYTFLENGDPLIPSDGIKAIYIIRNPLDVVVSYSYHCNCSIDEAISDLCNKNCCFYGENGKLNWHLKQKLLTWSGHVESWVDNAEMSVHIIRYEDMKNNPFETFKRAAIFSGLSYEDEKIKKAIEFSDFKILNKEEKKNGFKEKIAIDSLFFRKGKIGDWRNYLSEEQVSLIIKEHKIIMKRFGYLDDKENVIY